jgi:membrane protein required for colicin V production
MVGKILKRVIDWTPFGVLDNLAGAVIGIAKWALALSILLWVMSGLNINFPEKFTENSSVMPLISGFSTQVGNFISTIFPSFDSFINTLEELFESFTS